jgi:hypothetical protein
MSLSYYTSYPYPVPQYMESNPVAGAFTQPLGPYPALTPAGYGNPKGYEANTLGNPALAAQKGMVLLHDVAPNTASHMWNFANPQTTPMSMEEAQKVQEYLAQKQYLSGGGNGGSKSRMHSSTFGSVSMDDSGYVSYAGMDRHIPSYGHYSRSG